MVVDRDGTPTPTPRDRDRGTLHHRDGDGGGDGHPGGVGGDEDGGVEGGDGEGEAEGEADGEGDTEGDAEGDADGGQQAAEEEQRISYPTFLSIARTLSTHSTKFAPFFKPSVFYKLADSEGKVGITLFSSYVLRRALLLQARIDFSLYDTDDDGYLTEEQLEKYVTDVLPTFPQLQGVPKGLTRFYVCSAVRKFFYFLDPMRRGRISIKDMLLSPILTEFFELREPELSKEFLQTNWFSTQSILKVYGQYVALDTDQNGMLSRTEMSRYCNGTMTEAFLDRVFQEFQTYSGEMDFKTFLDFVLTMENVQTPEALTVMFRLLDINATGYLDDFVVWFFFKAVAHKLAAFGQAHPPIPDVVNEVFDMVNPVQYRCITLKDLTRSGVGGTVVNILADAQAFWQYENRESMG
ncbi:Serine/threonine-protein phosphatase 2A regulatory subunit B'' subunit gamma [Gonapodya sp. JEL0774]|nr:Serine/threonine-protein phosphatase 2A regulatory subunit B'' subunit gamma [Gonapodya sp. JEL0774]